MEGGYATYYENFDTSKNVPVKKKGIIPIIGCKIVISEHREKKNVFKLIHDTRKPVSLSVETEQLMTSNIVIRFTINFKIFLINSLFFKKLG